MNHKSGTYRIQNLTPHTYYCEYCGTEIKPGKWHECTGLYKEECKEVADAD